MNAPLFDNARWLKGSRIVAVVIALSAVAFISVIPPAANDFWLQAKVGEMIYHDHSIPETLLFPFTEVRDNRFNSHEWLPSLFFFGLIQTVGEDGLPLALGGLGLLLFACCWWMAYRRSGECGPLALLLAFVAVGVENYRHVLRPELASLLLLTVYLHLLDTFRYRPKLHNAVFALVLVVLWANCHGSFILAPIVAGVFAVGTWLDNLRVGTNAPHKSQTEPIAFAAFGVVALACALLNPSGWELIHFVFNFSNSPALKRVIFEWMPTFSPLFVKLPGLWIGIGCVAITLVAFTIRWRERSAVDLLMFLLFLALAMHAIRFVVYLGVVCAFVIAGKPPAWVLRDKHHAAIYGASSLVFITVLALAMGYGNAQGKHPHLAETSEKFTPQMVAALSDPKLTGNVLNTFAQGAELVYRTYPRLKPSIDSRFDSYGDEYCLFHETVLTNDALFQEFTTRYSVKYLLLDEGHFTKFRELRSWKDQLWVIHFKDHRLTLLKRRSEHQNGV